MPERKGGKTVTNQADLARELGCSHIALKKWITNSLYSDKRPARSSNNTYKVEGYKAWARFHGLEGRQESTEESVVSEEKRLKTELMRVKVATEQAKLDKTTGKLIAREIVSEVAGEFVSFLFRELDRVFGDEIPPRTRGLTEKQQSKLNRDELRTIFKQAKTKFEEGMAE